MIQEMLKQENVKILEQVTDWRDAIGASLKPLVDGGYVEPKYVDGVIESTLQYGPYYILAEDVALIHGRPEQGAISRQMAVTVLRRPVSFSETSSPVRLLIALAATDSESHIDVMRVLAGIFMDGEKIKEIVQSESEEEIFRHFVQAEQEIMSE